LTFEGLMRSRSAAEYADFVLPSVRDGDRVIDVGCGPGSITVGLAQVAGDVTGVDLDESEFTDARAYAAEHGIDNVKFVEGSIYQLDFADASFDVCTLFSMMETLDDPLAALAEVHRVVKPGGLVGASSIDYGGLILHGPDEPLLRRFYELRLQLWEAQATCTSIVAGNSGDSCWRLGSRRSKESPLTSVLGPRNAFGPSAWAALRTAETSGT